MLESPSIYNIANWLSMGLLDLGKGAIHPEKPLSLEHWLDSLGFASALYGMYETGKRAVALRKPLLKKRVDANQVEDRSKTDIHNPVVDGQRMGNANKPPDGQHGFPDMVDNYVGDAAHTQIIGADGITRDLYQLKGGYKYYDDTILSSQRIETNGSVHRIDVLVTKTRDTNGISEWIVEPDGSITHRRFIPGGKITGYPNQVVTGGN